MKNILTLFWSLTLVVGLSAQTIGDFKTKDQGRANNRMKKKEKRVYIADFQVNYQLGLALQDEQKGGRMFGGGVKGDTKATLVVGLAGIDDVDLQDMTNKLYEEYVTNLQSQGYEIVKPE